MRSIVMMIAAFFKHTPPIAKKKKEKYYIMSNIVSVKKISNLPHYHFTPYIFIYHATRMTRKTTSYNACV